MHTRSKSLLIGNPRQQGGQEFALARVKHGEQRILVLARHAANPLEKLLGLRGNFQPIDTTVARVFKSPHEASLLQFIHQRHESARKHAQPFCNLLLAGSGRGGNEAQRTDVRRRQAERTQPFGKFCRCMRSDLREEERRRCAFPSRLAVRLNILGTLSASHRPR